MVTIIRFLATRRSYEDLMYTAIILPQALERIIPDTRDVYTKHYADNI